MIDAPLALAFTTGMIVTVNPCGFAMLPAYLSFFVGAEADRPQADGARVVARALLVGLAVTVGFTATFAAVGFIVNVLTNEAFQVAPWFGVVIGLALVGFGIAMLAGFEAVVRLPHLERGGRTGGIGSMALFGVSYAVASIGCSLPLFASYTSLMFGRGLGSGIAFFVAYAAGFGVLIVALTLALALAKQSLVRSMRRVLPFVNRIAGGLLVLTGAYVTYYAVAEIRLSTNGTVPDDGLINRVTRWSSSAQNLITDTGATRIGAVLAVGLAIAVLFVTASRRRTP